MPSLVHVSPQDSSGTRHHVGKNSIMYMKSESKSTYTYTSVSYLQNQNPERNYKSESKSTYAYGGQTLSDDNATWKRKTLKAKYRFRKLKDCISLVEMLKAKIDEPWVHTEFAFELNGLYFNTENISNAQSSTPLSFRHTWMCVALYHSLQAPTKYRGKELLKLASSVVKMREETKKVNVRKELLDGVGMVTYVL